MDCAFGTKRTLSNFPEDYMLKMSKFTNTKNEDEALLEKLVPQFIPEIEKQLARYGYVPEKRTFENEPLRLEMGSELIPLRL
jgi:hypothetical protein